MQRPVRLPPIRRQNGPLPQIPALQISAYPSMARLTSSVICYMELHPFSALESPNKQYKSEYPVKAHGYPDKQHRQIEEFNKNIGQTYPEGPHGAHGYQHGKCHIRNCSQGVCAAKANPAMDAVPMVDTRLCTIILPSWNMPFSIPLGIPMCKISLITSGLKPSLKCLSTCI